MRELYSSWSQATEVLANLSQRMWYRGRRRKRRKKKKIKYSEPKSEEAVLRIQAVVANCQPHLLTTA